ncbi:MAG: S8 family peptidase [Anaerolineales bacterium]|nr:S8 family peptidase [Anaerolineales bacterium]
MDTMHRRWRARFSVWLLLVLPLLLFGAGRARASVWQQGVETLTPTETVSLSPSETPTPSPAATALPSDTPPSDTVEVPEPTVSLLVGLKAGNTLNNLKQRSAFPPQDVGLARLNVYRVDVPASRAEELRREMAAFPEVAYVEPDGVVTAQDVIPGDPGFPFQYALVNIRAPQGWEVTTGSHLVTIAIVDSGVDQTHPELAPKLLPGYDFVNADADPQDDNGHGTHVAGIAAAMSNNGVGMAGVSWGARILPVKVLNASNTGTYSNVAAGIVWATDQGAHIINLSLGGASPSLTLENAVNYAAAHGVLMAAAAGNTGGALLYPARYPAVIAVASTNAANLRAPSSAFGPELDLSAPGVSIYSLAIGGGYTTLSGTSMSAPHVSGALALLLSMSGVSPAQARSYLEASALDLDAPGWDIFTGYGLIQLDAALLLALPTATPTPTVSWTPAGGGLLPSRTPILLSWPVLTTPSEALTRHPSAAPGGSPMSPTLTPTASPSVSAAFSPLTLTPSAGFRTVFRSGRWAFQPCLGIFLLLAGLLLFLWARRHRRH